MTITNKNSKNNKKKTKKNRKENHNNLNQQQLIPKYDTFEDKVEDLFKKKHINLIASDYNLDKQILKDLNKAVSPSNINPQNDFYSYINDRWLKNTKLETGQKYITQMDDFRIVQDKVYRELLDIIEKYLKNPKNKKDKKRNCIKNAFESFKTSNTKSQQMVLARSIVQFIDDLMKDKDNLWKLLAKLNSNEIISWSCPFVWSINPDEKNPKVYKCYLEPPQLSLLDVEIYIDDGQNIEYKKKYKKNFISYLSDIFRNAFGPDHSYDVRDIFNCEKKILYAMTCDTIKETDDDNYNLVSKNEALHFFGFNWSKFALELGFKEIPDDFVTSNINYLLCGTKLLLEEWNSKEWRAYWIYIYIRQQQRFSYYGSTIYYKFYGKFLRGQEEIVDNTLKPVFPMCYLFNTFLTNEYINTYNNPDAVNYVKSMVEDLKIVFIRVLKRNSWLQPKTKEKALQKLYHLNILIGSDVIETEDPLLDYTRNDPWGNLVKMSHWRHIKAINLVGKPIINIPVIDWVQIPPKLVGKQAFLVNAFYTPTENSIYIPLGYIQKPFVDLDQRGLEYNLAHIGFTIAHEMSHALDDFGSKYNEFGVLNKWWTRKDEDIFLKIQKDVVKQYETFASYDNIKFDAWPSIGEDLADISGLSICIEYLRDFQLKNQDILPIQSLSFESFFVYFAMQQRQKINKQALQAQLKTNPHPLDKYRTNIPLSRLLIFRALFNVKKGDKMWWHSTNRVWDE